MLPNEEMYPYTAKEARDRGELELWRANFRSNCACAGAIELAIRRDFDGMHLKDGCAKSVIDQYGYKRVGYVLANTLQMQSYICKVGVAAAILSTERSRHHHGQSVCHHSAAAEVSLTAAKEKYAIHWLATLLVR